MKNFLLIAFLVLSFGAGADTVQNDIHSIVRGKDGEPHLIKFKSGVVEFIEQDEHQKLAEYEAKFEASQTAAIFKDRIKDLIIEEPEFEPTVLSDKDIKDIFTRMNSYMKRKSECSDRAHVWAWDEFQKSGTKSQKAFLFLTDTYIKRNRYKWWFHVAPMYTNDSGQKIVMDNQFLDRPVPFDEWKNFLVFSKRQCVTDFRFLDYNEGADQTQDCYVKFEPMFYRIPGDIGAREKGTPRTSWNASEVNSARTRAFFKGGM